VQLQVLPAIPWYHERLMHQTSLGSLMVVILIRTIKYNLSKLRVGIRIFVVCTGKLKLGSCLLDLPIGSCLFELSCYLLLQFVFCAQHYL
jgi:hypothetical protein